MPTTSNFGWTTPADTDLVKNGALAIRTLGNGIDTSLVDLKGGTTGQILSKASNTDLDYTWINNDQGDITEVQAGTGISVASGTGPIPIVTNTVATAFDAKGDLVAGTGADTFSKLTVGANNTVLTADSSTATGLKWATPASPTAVGCLVYAGSNFDVANNTDTIINFDTEAFDTDAFHSTTTNTSRITIPSGKAGKYYIFWTTGMANGFTGQRRVRILKNGSTYQDFLTEPSAGTWWAMSGSSMADLAVADYIQLQFTQGSGGTRTYYGDSSITKACQFGVFYLGA